MKLLSVGGEQLQLLYDAIFEQEQNMIIYLCGECYNTIKNDKGYTLRKPPVEKTKCKMCGRMCYGYGIEIKDVEGKQRLAF